MVPRLMHAYRERNTASDGAGRSNQPRLIPKRQTDAGSPTAVRFKIGLSLPRRKRRDRIGIVRLTWRAGSERAPGSTLRR